MKDLLSLITSNILSFKKSMNFRDGQKVFYDAIVNGLRKGWTKMYIEGPTGMGKTFIESAVAGGVIGNSDIRVLLLTSKIELLTQIQGEFKKFAPYLTTGLFGGGKKDYRQQVTIMTYDSYRILPKHIAKQYQVVLMDEGHKGLGKSTRAKLEYQKEFSIIIGFTASAEYNEKKSLDEFLENCAHQLSIVEAIELGMLSDVKVFLASINIEISNRNEGEARVDYESRLSAEIIRKGGNIAAAIYYKEVFAKRKLRMIISVLNTTQGENLVAELGKSEIGVKAKLIHSKLHQKESREILRQFRNNEFEVLVGMGMIKEGYDDPGVSGVITAYPVNSLVDTVQFPGRALRIDKENPDKIAYITHLVFQGKKQLFYSDVLEGRVEVSKKGKKRKKQNEVTGGELDAFTKKSHSYISSIAITHQEVLAVMKQNRGLEAYSKEEALELAKAELKNHGIMDRVSLIKTGVEPFSKKSFGEFGGGISLASFILPSTCQYVTLSVLEQIAEKLGWNDSVKTLENAKVELAKHGIVNRISLMEVGSMNFRKLDFGVFGKGTAFTNFLLPNYSIKRVTLDFLENIAGKLGWEDQLTLELAKVELAKHGIVNRISLMEVGSMNFKKLDFGVFGKGTAFTSFLLPDHSIKKVTFNDLENIAEKLGWNDSVKTLENAKVELAKHGIVNRISLMKVGSNEFRMLDFGAFGKAKAFTNFLLPNYSIKNVNLETLKNIADTLDW